MKKGAERATRILSLCTLCMAVCLLLAPFLNGRDQMEDDGSLERVLLMGEYRIGEQGDFLPLENHAQFQLHKGEEITFRGHFSREIEKNQTLMMRINHFFVRMDVNNQTVFTFGDKGTYPAFLDSPGNVWQSYTSQGVSTEDVVTIRLTNAYQIGMPLRVSEFLDQLWVGSERQLTRRMVSAHWLELTVAAVSLSIGASVLLLTLVGVCMKIRFEKILPLFGAVMFTGGGWLLGEYDCASLFLTRLAFHSLFCGVCQFLLPAFTALYAGAYVKSRMKIVTDVAVWGSFGFAFTACLLQLLGVVDLYELRTAGNLIAVAVVASSIVALAYESRIEIGKAARYNLQSLLPLCIGALIDLACYYGGVTVHTYGTQIGFLLFGMVQAVVLLLGMKDSQKRALQLENDLFQSRIAMMLSQIQPHFLYNSLTAIKQLCVVDPERAEEAVGDFASYLRTNLDAMSVHATIPLSREISHISHYIRLEQMRFGERVKVCYDLRYDQFSVPTLTVQPLVENAVRYGITKKPDGGTVTIFADETDTAYLVRVSDDGVGFDPNAILSTERSHIGLENVRSRLEALCDATLTIESQIGKGTSVTIQIPKKEADSI